MEFKEAIGLLKDDFDAVKKDLENRGFPSAWVSKVPDIEYNASFLPEGKMKNGPKIYLSDCSYYEGIYLCGGLSAVKCELVSEVIPGIVKDLYCSKEHEQCPIKCK